MPENAMCARVFLCVKKRLVKQSHGPQSRFLYHPEALLGQFHHMQQQNTAIIVTHVTLRCILPQNL